MVWKANIPTKEKRANESLLCLPSLGPLPQSFSPGRVQTDQSCDRVSSPKEHGVIKSISVPSVGGPCAPQPCLLTLRSHALALPRYVEVLHNYFLAHRTLIPLARHQCMAQDSRHTRMSLKLILRFPVSQKVRFCLSSKSGGVSQSARLRS